MQKSADSSSARGENTAVVTLVSHLRYSHSYLAYYVLPHFINNPWTLQKIWSGNNKINISCNYTAQLSVLLILCYISFSSLRFIVVHVCTLQNRKYSICFYNPTSHLLLYFDSLIFNLKFFIIIFLVEVWLTYIIILVSGVWFFWCSKSSSKSSRLAYIFIAHRNIMVY